MTPAFFAYSSSPLAIVCTHEFSSPLQVPFEVESRRTTERRQRRSTTFDLRLAKGGWSMPRLAGNLNRYGRPGGASSDATGNFISEREWPNTGQTAGPVGRPMKQPPQFGTMGSRGARTQRASEERDVDRNQAKIRTV